MSDNYGSIRNIPRNTLETAYGTIGKYLARAMKAGRGHTLVGLPGGPIKSDDIIDLFGEPGEALDDWSHGFGPVRFAEGTQGLAGRVAGMKVDPRIPDVAALVPAGRAANAAHKAVGRELGKQMRRMGMTDEAFEGTVLARGGSPAARAAPTVRLREGNERYANLGIYDDPRQIVADSAEKLAPESPHLKELFSVDRQDLDEMALQKQDPRIASSFLYEAQRPPEHVFEVANPQNAKRLQDIVYETAQHPGFTGMAGWYETDPFTRYSQRLLGDKLGRETAMEHHRATSSMSPRSRVDVEIPKGSLAHMLRAQGRMGEFYNVGNMPAGLGGLAHASAHSAAARNLERSGGQMFWNPLDPPQKTGPYYHTKTGQNYDLPVGDAHWVRGVALPDVRKWKFDKKRGLMVPDDESIGKTEAGVLLPWYGREVAAPLGLTGGVAQPLQWGGMASRTNVRSDIGAPLLEITATQIARSAARQGITPKEALDNYLRIAAGQMKGDPFKAYLGSLLGAGVVGKAVLDEEKLQ